MNKNTNHYLKKFNNCYFDFIGQLECLPIFHFKTTVEDYILRKVYVSKSTKNYPQGTYEFICRKAEDDNYILQFNFNDCEFHMCSSFDKIDDIKFNDYYLEKFKKYLNEYNFKLAKNIMLEEVKQL